MEIADIIKLDVLDLGYERTQDTLQLLKPYKAKLLAEKIETEEEFDAFRELGFDFFQGYFLARPKVMKGKKVPSNQLPAMKIMAALQDPQVDYDEIEQIVCMDVSLSHQLLRYINSTYLALPTRVDSIRQVTYLGIRETKRWATLIAMSGCSDRPAELLNMALVRASMCELLAEAAGSDNNVIYLPLLHFIST